MKCSMDKGSIVYKLVLSVEFLWSQIVVCLMAFEYIVTWLKTNRTTLAQNLKVLVEVDFILH